MVTYPDLCKCWSGPAYGGSANKIKVVGYILWVLKLARVAICWFTVNGMRFLAPLLDSGVKKCVPSVSSQGSLRSSSAFVRHGHAESFCISSMRWELLLPTPNRMNPYGLQSCEERWRQCSTCYCPSPGMCRARLPFCNLGLIFLETSAFLLSFVFGALSLTFS